MTTLKAVAIALAVALGAGSAATAATLAPQTRENLQTAMHGEAFAHLKYRRYAEIARAAGHEDLAKLFETASTVESDEHFAREADALQLAGTDEANLLDAMAGEHYENQTMYVTFADQAEKAGDTKVAAMFRQIAEDEGDHYEKYKSALAQLRGR